MRRPMLSAVLPLLAAGSALWLASAQEPAPIKQAIFNQAAPAKPRDLSKLTPAQRQAYLSARRAMDWLRRTNKPDGRFVYGFLPDLRVPLDGDSYVAQAGAAYAMARAAHWFGDEPSLAVSRQALLTLLLETAVDAKDAQVRYTAAPPHLVDRQMAHGLLLLAIHELPEPGKDLLDQAEQLANYLRKQQQADGALFVAEAGEDAKSAATEDGFMRSGLALHGIARSQRHRPAAWKLESLKKARVYYQGCWQKQKSQPLAVAHVPACAEAYLLTKDQAYADCVFAMADWLCGQQYQQVEPARAHWVGGFPVWVGGKSLALPPDIRSAECAESLAEACRVARQAGDLPRLRRYSEALDGCLRFVQTLQYTDGRVQHYVEGFRPAVLGAFFASPQDGKLRIDFTQHALSALVLYLEQVME